MEDKPRERNPDKGDLTDNSFRDKLVSLAGRMAALLEGASALPGMDPQPFHQWEKTCRSILAQAAGDILRVAVVGSIKSGKSTFVNSLLAHDYLKRGAGVVTSIVTRVRGGKDLKAELYKRHIGDEPGHRPTPEEAVAYIVELEDRIKELGETPKGA